MSKKSEYYHKTINIWDALCELHKELLDQTSNEYLMLLSSDVDGVEKAIAKKQETIQEIANLDKNRIQHVKEINNSLSTNIDNFFELNKFFGDLDIEKSNNHLNKFNLVLKELIENIQRQNKTNQLFINKAIVSLDKIKNAGTGNKSYSLYNKSGALKK